MKATSIFHRVPLLLILAASSAMADQNVPPKAWTDPAVALREDPDFAIQGEYTAEGIGAQVIALGNGQFDAFLLEGGLPGAGWESGKNRTALTGSREGGKVLLKDAAGQVSITIDEGRMILSGMENKHLFRIERRSPTLGAKAPDGALVLFDGHSTDAWENGKMENSMLLATGATTRRRFGNYTLHVEFRTPYMPNARGQQRGNSGVYHSGRWETQILDSFGLEARDNHCGGIYSIAKPSLNMGLPPLAWQTYDVEFTAARFNAAGKRTDWPRITVKLNGVVIHENLELSKDFTTSAPMGTPLASAEGPIFLQDHKNPVFFRNIWIKANP